MGYFVFLYRSGQDIRDIVLASFPTISSEIEYDIRQFEKARDARRTAVKKMNEVVSARKSSRKKAMKPPLSSHRERSSTLRMSDMPAPSPRGLTLNGLRRLRTPRRESMSKNSASARKKKLTSPHTPGGSLVQILTSTPGNMGTPVLRSRSIKRMRMSTTPLSSGEEQQQQQQKQHTPGEPQVVRSAAKSWASKKYFERQIEGKKKKEARHTLSMLSVLAPPQVVMRSPGLLLGEKE